MKVGLNYYAQFLPGGKQSMIDLARLSDRENVRNVALLYDQMGVNDRGRVILDELCAGALVSTSDFIGAVASVAHAQSMDASKMIAALAQPKVLEAAIARANDGDGGHADRKMLLQVTGLLPTPSGARIAIDNRSQAFAGAVAGSNGPSFDDVIRSSAEVVRK